VLMQVHIADHPLVAHKITLLRDTHTPSAVFRALASELVSLLAYEATKNLPVVDHPVETPVEATVGKKLATPRPVIVPILRAGLGMLEGMVHLLPSAEVGFLGMVRDEQTLQPSVYAQRLPEDLAGRHCFVLDPMLATGGSLVQAIRFLHDRGATNITAVCLLAAPEGIQALEEGTSDVSVTLVVGAVDQKLNERGFIVPGLGDAGDRLYGVVGS